MYASKKYIMKLSNADIECVMLDVVDKFETYIVRLLRESRNDIVELESYRNARKGNSFLIQCGKYFEICKTIHKESKGKDEAEILNMLKRRLKKDTYQFQDFRNINFSGISLDNLDLLYCDFSGSEMRAVQFKGMQLMGARFTNCDLTNAVFKDSNMNGIDFRKVKLDSTVFENTYLEESIFTEEQLSKITIDTEQIDKIIVTV